LRFGLSVETAKGEKMKRLYFVSAIAVMLLAALTIHAQDPAKGEKLFKTKCAGCHGADAAGKAAVKSPSIKGKTSEEIQKEISTSAKHASVKSLTADQVKDIAAYLGTLK
jgi:mono/diheme cytochrome c family protein